MCYFNSVVVTLVAAALPAASLHNSSSGPPRLVTRAGAVPREPTSMSRRRFSHEQLHTAVHVLFVLVRCAVVRLSRCGGRVRGQTSRESPETREPRAGASRGSGARGSLSALSTLASALAASDTRCARRWCDQRHVMSTSTAQGWHGAMPGRGVEHRTKDHAIDQSMVHMRVVP